MPMKSADVAQRRFRVALDHALGPEIREALADETVVEVMANPDGRLWIERRRQTKVCVGSISAHAVEAIIRLIAAIGGQIVTVDRPMVAGTIPGTGERFQGVMPPVSAAPMFSIRKHASVIYSLDDFAEQGIVTHGKVAEVREALVSKRNVFVVGPTGSGKTTFVNAILTEPCIAHERIVIIEDTKELRCGAPNCVGMLTREVENRISLANLVKTSLRLAPDRVVIGEMRGSKLQEVRQASVLGHPLISTLHAESVLQSDHELCDVWVRPNEPLY